ncbi:MAG: hypothetical protein ACD_67C00122G0003 [uncultured bacterium]|nr:MAG: hypothetical protein ACD_67C00122G0003 [uncultured bacterium]
MSERLFVYGTLKDPKVQRKIIGRELIGEPDVLEKYAVAQITLDDSVYPILIEAMNNNVGGLVLEVAPSDFSVLDEYEGDEYKRVRVKLRSGKLAWVYKKNK